MTTAETNKAKAGLTVCGLNDILFPVEKVEVTEHDCNSDYAYDIFAYPDGKKKRVNSCSDRYALVPNSEIFPPVRNLLAAHNIKFSERYMHMNHARFYAEFTIEDQAYKVGNNPNDIIYPMLKVQHSYNGLTEYQITFGYYRLVCTNGLVLPVKEKSEFNIRINGKHTKAIHASLKKLDDALNFFIAQGKKPMANYNVMYDHWVEKWEDRVVEVLGASKIANIDNSKFKTTDYLATIITREANNLTGGKVNDWLIYNAINQYVHDSKLNVASPKQREDKDKSVLNFLLTDLGVF